MLDEITHSAAAIPGANLSVSESTVETSNILMLENLLKGIESDWKTGLRICNKVLREDEYQQEAQRIRHQLVATFFPHWHISMMKDTVRNLAFKAAFERVDWRDKVVLEIGTGAGLLAMLVAKAGAEHVYTCESNSVLADLAKQVIHDNGFGDKITVIGKKSTDITVGKEIPKVADVLVTETLGSDFLNEGILTTLDDARARLLHEDANILPGKVKLYGVPIASTSLRESVTIGECDGLDLRRFNQFVNYKNFQLVDCYQSDYDFIGEPALLLDADLTSGVMTNSSSTTFTPRADAVCDGILYWMSVDIDQQSSFSNSPMNDEASRTHWRQCLFLFDTPVLMEKAQAYCTRLQVGREFLRFDGLMKQT